MSESEQIEEPRLDDRPSPVSKEEDGYQEDTVSTHEGQHHVCPGPENQTEVKRSSHNRRPRQILTYENLGQPRLITPAVVNSAHTNIKILVYNLPYATQPYTHLFHRHQHIHCPYCTPYLLCTYTPHTFKPPPYILPVPVVC